MSGDVPSTILELWLNTLTEETWCEKQIWEKTSAEEVYTKLTHPRISNPYYFFLSREFSTSIVLKIFTQTDTNSLLVYERKFVRRFLTGVAQENLLFEKALELYELAADLLAHTPPPLLRTFHFLIS